MLHVSLYLPIREVTASEDITVPKFEKYIHGWVPAVESSVSTPSRAERCSVMGGHFQTPNNYKQISEYPKQKVSVFNALSFIQVTNI